MRFDDEAHLARWKETGLFPKIHESIARLVLTEVEMDPDDGALLDLCCSIGLLGQRLFEQRFPNVCGIDQDAGAIMAGDYAGLGYRRRTMPIWPNTLDDFINWIKFKGVRTVVARRCLSELFHGHKPQGFPVRFAAALHDVGVREIVIEGRARIASPTHDYPTIEQEVEPLLRWYRVAANRGPDVAYLVAR